MKKLSDFGFEIKKLFVFFKYQLSLVNNKNFYITQKKTDKCFFILGLAIFKFEWKKIFLLTIRMFNFDCDYTVLKLKFQILIKN